jgi:hypothetical protein
MYSGQLDVTFVKAQFLAGVFSFILEGAQVSMLSPPAPPASR